MIIKRRSHSGSLRSLLLYFGLAAVFLLAPTWVISWAVMEPAWAQATVKYPGRLPAGGSGRGRDAEGIPRILHYIYVSDNHGSAGFPPPHHSSWVDSCTYHYSASGWQIRLWDARSAEAFVAERYPWMLDLYRDSGLQPVMKSDLLRLMILHDLGGLYLDSDVHCLREGSHMLEGCDVVIQGTSPFEGAVNAAMASRPGLDLWLTALRMAQNRTVPEGFDPGFQAMALTGPFLLTAALEAMGLRRSREGEGGLFERRYREKGIEYCIHPAGTWFEPCLYGESKCWVQLYTDLANGKVDLKRIVGIHRHAGSWIHGSSGRGYANARMCPAPPAPAPPAPQGGAVAGG